MSHQVELTFRFTDSPTAQEGALNYLLQNAGEAFTEAQLREALGTPRSTTHVVMQDLVRQNLVVLERVGRTGVYSADTRDPLIRQLKIARSVRRVQLAIRPVETLIDLAVMFGSAARGQNRSESDIDLLVVTSSVAQVLDALAPNLWLQPIVVTPAQHMTLIAENTTLILETQDGIRITERR